MNSSLKRIRSGQSANDVRKQAAISSFFVHKVPRLERRENEEGNVYKEALETISFARSTATSTTATTALASAIELKTASLPASSALLFKTMSSYRGFQRHGYSESLLARYPSPTIPADCIAISVSADGNCLFNAASVLIAGTEQYATELRVRTCIELNSRRSSYVTHSLAANIFMLSPDFDKALHYCAADGGHSCMWAMFGLASVLRRSIISMYPVTNEKDDAGIDAASLSNMTLFPIMSDEIDDLLSPLRIMWTRVNSDGPLPWTPNHFAPLVKQEVTGSGEESVDLQHLRQPVSLIQVFDASTGSATNQPEPVTSSNDSSHHLLSSIICDANTVTCDGAEKDADLDRPLCWTIAQCTSFKTERDWVIVHQRQLGCKICREVKSLNIHKTMGMKLSTEWMACEIKSYGADRAQQQTSLRKKIWNHANSEAHKSATLVLSESKRSAIPRLISDQYKHHLETTNCVFRTAYNIAKNNRPFADLPSQIDLQVLNGINMGRILHSKISAANIITHIAHEMKTRLVERLLRLQSKFAIMVDESTTLSGKTTLIIYLRCALGAASINVFFNLVELDSTNAVSITDAILRSLSAQGITDDIMRETLIGIACDGASVMLGRKTGVASRLQHMFPRIVIWHCLAHRLELAVHDTVLKVAGINNFKIFMDKLYCVYHMSPKNRVELHQCANDLGIQLLAIGKVLDTRWVASSVRTLKAVWQSFPALHAHFMKASGDQTRDSKERSIYSGLAARLTANQFVSNLGYMYDACLELSELSLELQKRLLTLPAAHRSICRQVRVLESMIDNPGRFSSAAEQAIQVTNFQDVAIHNGRKCDVQINRQQFFRSLATNLRTRIMDTEKDDINKTFIEDLKVLYPENWPDDVDAMYGQACIDRLAQRFNVECRSSIRAFRAYTDNGGKTVPEELLPLIECCTSLPVSTAECERGFSQMNLIMTPARNSLAIRTLASLLFLRLVGPPLKKFQPETYVRSWLATGHHSADDRNSCVREEQYDNIVYEHLWNLF